jgi:aminoglycoside 6'-N-acetyltransferase I
MTIVDLAAQPEGILEKAARFLIEQFDGPLGWSEMDSAREEVTRVLRDGFACAMVEAPHLIGWIGGLPEYAGRVWELHPIVVHSAFRRQGFGRALVAAFELEARNRGALTATLGTDDNTGMTSLAGGDLYSDLPGTLQKSVTSVAATRSGSI